MTGERVPERGARLGEPVGIQSTGERVPERGARLGEPVGLRSTERRWFVTAVASLWLLFFVQAWNAPVILDDWFQLTWWRHHDFGASALWEYGHYNYFHFNPRLGDVYLVIVNGPRALHLVLTPLVEMLCLWVTFAIAFGRLPRPTLRDLQLLLFVQVMIWIVVPIPGLMYFYRPFATNYLWSFTFMLALFVPYRLSLAGPRHYLILPMLGLGWIAGMGNEHTGPAAMVAMAGFIVHAWRTHRLQPWMLAGALGLYIGYPMLFFAPGQLERYAGSGNHFAPSYVLASRGISGCFAVVVDFIAESQLGIDLFIAGVIVYVRNAVPVPRATLFAAGALLLGAFTIVATLFAAIYAGERLFFAPGLLLVAALAALTEHLFDDRATRRLLVGACVVIFAYHAFRFVQVYAVVKAENDARLAALRAAPAETVARVEPYRDRRRSRWAWGDDFRYAMMREYIANEVYDLKGIELTRHLRWAEPMPPDHYVAHRYYDPPLPPDVAAAIAPVHYTPTFWEWSIIQLRRLLAMSPIADYQGHKLVRYEVTAEGVAFDDPQHRPIRVFEWTPTGGFTFVDSYVYDDNLSRPNIRIWQSSVPPRANEFYVIGCGHQRRVEPVPDVVGPMLPIVLECHGVYTAIACEPDRCWLAGRVWK